MALEMLTALGLIAASFAATNFDNLALLTSWLIAARGHSTPIFIGHLLGMFVLLVLSFVFGLAANLVPIDWIGFLGVIPIIMGLIGLKQLRGLPRVNTETESTRVPRTGLALPLSIATTQVANGVDTVLVFGPLFADSSETIDFEILIGFAGMAFVWFGLARFLENHATRIKVIDRYGHWVAPIVMIIVGIYILSDTQTDVLPG
jgi:cadmium resistance protein CadD (predicted permease)